MGSVGGKLKKVVVVGLWVLAWALVLEISLQLACLVSPQIRVLLTGNHGFFVADKKVGFRPNPIFPYHDRKGFRNGRVPDRATVVAMGDSMTYGAAVLDREAWPSRLEQITGTTVYNMGVPGYGPVQRLLLLDEAVAIRPRLIIDCVYLGNDLSDCYRSVYQDGLMPELKSPEPVPKGLVEKGSEEPAEVDGGVNLRLWHRRLQRTVLDHSRLVSALHLLRLWLYPRTIPALLPSWDSLKRTARGSDYFLAVEHGDLRTLLSPGRLLKGVDPNDPRFQEGRRICFESIRKMHEAVKAVKKDFLVLIVPSKDLVFEDTIRKAGIGTTDTFESAVGAEKQLLQDFKKFLKDAGIRFVDALPILQECLRKGEQPYFIHEDGHPNEIGHRAIASRLAQEIARQEHH